MTFSEKLRTVARVDNLIKLKATGNSQTLSKRLGVSRSTLYLIFQIMRELGAEIEYNKFRSTYFYKTEMDIIL